MLTSFHVFCWLECSCIGRWVPSKHNSLLWFCDISTWIFFTFQKLRSCQQSFLLNSLVRINTIDLFLITRFHFWIQSLFLTFLTYPFFLAFFSLNRLGVRLNWCKFEIWHLNGLTFNFYRRITRLIFER